MKEPLKSRRRGFNGLEVLAVSFLFWPTSLWSSMTMFKTAWTSALETENHLCVENEPQQNAREIANV
jgi:hypothetical protein